MQSKPNIDGVVWYSIARELPEYYDELIVKRRKLFVYEGTFPELPEESQLFSIFSYSDILPPDVKGITEIVFEGTFSEIEVLTVTVDGKIWYVLDGESVCRVREEDFMSSAALLSQYESCKKDAEENLS